MRVALDRLLHEIRLRKILVLGFEGTDNDLCLFLVNQVAGGVEQLVENLLWPLRHAAALFVKHLVYVSIHYLLLRAQNRLNAHLLENAHAHLKVLQVRFQTSQLPL